jgi:hypothetical protein
VIIGTATITGLDMPYASAEGDRDIALQPMEIKRFSLQLRRGLISVELRARTLC